MIWLKHLSKLLISDIGCSHNVLSPSLQKFFCCTWNNNNTIKNILFDQNGSTAMKSFDKEC